MRNEYIPFTSVIEEVIRHTDTEYTFRMSYSGSVRPGQFFEVSIPKFGEAPISVSGIGDNTVDLTIRRVGKVTSEIFENYIGDTLLMRGPYGNGFDLDLYRGKELVVVAGGTGVSPVRGVIDYFAHHTEEVKSMTAIIGFKSSADVLFYKDLADWSERIRLIATLDKKTDRDSFYQEGLVTKFIPDLTVQNLSEVAAIVVGSPAMMKFAVAALLERGLSEENIWISQERKMCCGIGKCGHCRMGSTYICLDGPVFCYTQGKNLFD